MAKPKKPKFTTIEGIPTWATCYIMYGDTDAYTPKEDWETVDNYLEELREKGYRLVEPKDGTKNDFNQYPAFGLACETEDWIAEVVDEEVHA